MRKTKLFVLLLLTFLFVKGQNSQIIQGIKAAEGDSLNKISRVSKAQLEIDKNLVLGKFDYKKNKNFVKVSDVHSFKTLYLNSEAYQSFIKMYKEAKKNNISLKIVSGTRNFQEQKAIWERKWEKYAYLEPLKRAKKILEFSSMPTTSRHHWGTDIDLNNLNNSYYEKGEGKKEYDWLVSNAHRFGFYQVYTSKEKGRTGYNVEKWHWSYLPLANKYLNFYNENVSYKDINGFEGSEYAKEVEMILKYVNGIAQTIIN